jgi:ketosteroid isomerase-like protein
VSRQNVEIVRQATDAYNRGDLEEALGWMHPEIEWDMSRVPVPDPGVFRGYAGLMAFHNSWEESFESMELEAEEYLEAGDQVISVVRHVGRGRLSEVEVEQTFAQLWTVRDGKIIRMEMHEDRDAALEAAQLSQQDVQAKRD